MKETQSLAAKRPPSPEAPSGHQLVDSQRQRKARTFWTRLKRELRGSVIGQIGLTLIVVMILVAIFAPLLSPHDPYAMHTEHRLLGPSLYYPLGTDEFGRDILSRVLYGSRISLYVGIVSVGIALVIGGLLGLASGYAGGILDSLINRVLDIMFAFPAILLAIALVAVLGPELRNVMIAIGIVYTPSFARIVRGPVLSVKQQEFVEAARVTGASTGRLLFRHILPNVSAPLIVQATIAFSFAILSEAALSFLGLGAQPPEPSWGSMLNAGRRFLEVSPWLGIWPGLAIMLAVLGFNLFGDWIRDVLDPRRAD